MTDIWTWFRIQFVTHKDQKDPFIVRVCTLHEVYARAIIKPFQFGGWLKEPMTGDAHCDICKAGGEE